MVGEFFQFAALSPVTLLAVNRICSLIEPATSRHQLGIHVKKRPISPYHRVTAFRTKSHDGASRSKLEHIMTVANEAAMPAASPSAVMEEAVAFLGTYKTSLRQKLLQDLSAFLPLGRQCSRGEDYGCIPPSSSDCDQAL